MLSEARLLGLVARFGTPLYLYDLDVFDESVRSLSRALPDPHGLYYSVKANPLPAILERARGHGLGAEVSSIGELRLAIDAAFAPKAILCSGPAKGRDFIAAGVSAGCTFSVESEAELDHLEAEAVRARVPARALLRVNPTGAATPGGLSISGGPQSKFGLTLGSMQRALARTEVKIEGLHIYWASNIRDTDLLSSSLVRSVSELAEISFEIGLRPLTIDLGGGFPSLFATKGESEMLDLGLVGDCLDSKFSGWRQGSPQVLFEAGRALAGPCGTLVCSVLDRKGDADHTTLIVDAGINHLGGMSGLRRALPIHAEASLTPSHPAGATALMTISGPLCTPLDTWNRSMLPTQVRIGDILTVPNVGAYGLTASLVGFISHQAPAEIAVSEDHIVSARRLELVSQEIV